MVGVWFGLSQSTAYNSWDATGHTFFCNFIVFILLGASAAILPFAVLDTFSLDYKFAWPISCL
jgi:hypothetical protein